MDYKSEIKDLSVKTELNFDELLEMISALYQKKNNTEITKNVGLSILTQILGENGKAAALAVHNSEQLQAVMRWIYKVEDGEGYLIAK